VCEDNSLNLQCSKSFKIAWLLQVYAYTTQNQCPVTDFRNVFFKTQIAPLGSVHLENWYTLFHERLKSLRGVWTTYVMFVHVKYRLQTTTKAKKPGILKSWNEISSFICRQSEISESFMLIAAYSVCFPTKVDKTLTMRWSTEFLNLMQAQMRWKACNAMKQPTESAFDLHRHTWVQLIADFYNRRHEIKNTSIANK
jgi:hypothetical protein